MHCITCELTAKRDSGESPIWDNIYRSNYWDVVHAYNTSLPGWLVLVARRHIDVLDQLTESESIELGKLIRAVSLTLKEVTGCNKTYMAQFAEVAGHSHVHVHIIPRLSDLPDNLRGTGIFAYLGVPEIDRVSLNEMDKLAQKIQICLHKHI